MSDCARSGARTASHNVRLRNRLVHQLLRATGVVRSDRAPRPSAGAGGTDDEVCTVPPAVGSRPCRRGRSLDRIGDPAGEVRKTAGRAVTAAAPSAPPNPPAAARTRAGARGRRFASGRSPTFAGATTRTTCLTTDRRPYGPSDASAGRLTPEESADPRLSETAPGGTARSGPPCRTPCRSQRLQPPVVFLLIDLPAREPLRQHLLR
jgi:hypothetical protein